MKLFVGDTREVPDGTWTLVRTAKEAITLLQEHEGEIEEISLDHDLGEGLDGYHLLKWIEAKVFLHSYKPPGIMLVHSANPVGKANMEAAIRSIREMENK